LESKAAQDLAAFLEASRSGTRRAWLNQYFHPPYPKDVDDVSVFFDILSASKGGLGREVVRCPNCGRLYVEKARFANEWQSFKPEDETK